ncbi:MAG: undecaprenyl diphosphate synthase family protein, partial [Patescibacteria group bacterium]
IRTSGEQRTSGILLWQSHYAETYWEQGHFPDFNPEKLKMAVLDYSRRRRRFGGDDSVEHFSFKPELVANLELSWWRLANIPSGTRFRDYALKHLKAQFGLSKDLAKEAAYHMIEGAIYGEKKDWKKSFVSLKKFYKVIKDEVKLAFEPSIVADLEVRLLKETNGGESVAQMGKAEETTRELYAEVYRISLLQAAKVAHLRVLASVERNLALRGFGKEHWAKAEDYLEKFYRALKERVA